MIGSLKAFIAALASEERPRSRFESAESRLAIAALLIRVATIEREISQAGRERLHAVLRSSFGLDDAATARLFGDAAATDRSAIDLYHFTRQLNDALDHEARRQFVKMKWQVAYLDEPVNELASNIIWRVADLLGVSSRERIELRQRVATDRPVPRGPCIMEQIPDGALESHAS